MHDLTQRLSVLIVAGLSTFAVFAAGRGALMVVAMAADASPRPAITKTHVRETRPRIWDAGVRPAGGCSSAAAQGAPTCKSF
jgi:hypothetical protein